MKDNIHTYAYKYRQLGLSVIPVKSKGKTPLIPWQPYQKKIPTEQEINQWFKKKWPSANIGIITGTISKIVALDLDRKNEEDGEQSLRGLLGEIPDTPLAKTPNGLHLFFKHPGNGTHLSNFARKLPGLDLRADGGYVVAPPSIGSNGGKYGWINSIFDTPLPPLPDKLLRLITSQKTTPRTLRTRDKNWLSEVLTGVERGKRNDTGTRLAGYLLRKHTPDIALAFLRNWNTNNQPPLPDHELISIINSVKGYHPEAKDHHTTFENMLAEGYQDIGCYLQPDLVGAGDLMVIGGSEGIGKTLLVTNLALCLASGEPFFRLDITEPIHTYLIQFELPYERYKKRHWPLIEYFKDRVRHTLTIHKDPRNIRINTRLFNDIRDIGAKAVIIDPFTHIWGEGYEQQSRAVKDLMDFCRIEQIAVIVTHHRRKVGIGEQKAQRGTDSLLGSSHLKNQAATIALISEIYEENDSITTVFEFHKTRYTNKYASILAPRWLKLNKDNMMFEEEAVSPGVKIQLAIGNSLDGELTFTEIQERLGCNPSIVARYLKKMMGSKVKKVGRKYRNMVEH